MTLNEKSVLQSLGDSNIPAKKRIGKTKRETLDEHKREA
jgi:hypothetical protein